MKWLVLQLHPDAKMERETDSTRAFFSLLVFDELKPCGMWESGSKSTTRLLSTLALRVRGEVRGGGTLVCRWENIGRGISGTTVVGRNGSG